MSTAYIGIRNGVTSAQGVSDFFDIGVNVYLVDTAAADIVFHPKIYAGYNKSLARIIMGSANLTLGGLSNNIEASAIIEIDRQNTSDEDSLTGLLDTFSELPRKYPDNVIQLLDRSAVDALIEEGRLEDEYVVRVPSANDSARNIRRDSLRRITCNGFRPPLPPKPHSKPIVSSSTDTMVLVWKSKELTERDLNIPTGSRTNPTGSMGLKKGQLEDIDQRHYFRDIVFAALPWSFDKNPGKTHLERAEAKFNLRIKGIDYGWYDLRLTHNSKKNSKAYEQKNWMTQIHWDTAKPLIAQRDLLGRILQLYAHGTGTRFTLQID